MQKYEYKLEKGGAEGQSHQQGAGHDPKGGLRRALGIREGDSPLFDLEDGEVWVRVKRKPVSFADYAGAWREG